jgi:glycosyltransferase involved in cell wall biosynthesis
MGVKRDDIELIYNGIDCSQYTVCDSETVDKFRDRLGIKNGPVVGIVARLSDVKGHKYLIYAFREVIKTIPDAQLLIVGDGKMKDELIRLVDNLNIHQSVLFIPSVLDISLVLAVMDVFVMPSIQEGLGLAIMQAQAAGLPVIASDVGGITALVKHGQTGMLVEVGDIRGIASSVISLLDNKDLAKSLGVNAQKNICQNFSLEKMATKIEKLYSSCIRPNMAQTIQE